MIESFNPRRGMKISHRRESGFRYEIAAIDPALGRAVVTLRVYATAARAYACLWAGAATGSGMAGGYGYHRASAAATEAFEAAGVKLTYNIAGVVDMHDAVEALARHIGVESPIIHEAHP